MTQAIDEWADRAALRALIEAWVLWRDSGQWDQLLALWAEDGVMSATWTQAGARDFVAASRAACERGLDVLHTLGGTVVELSASPKPAQRAIAQTKMTIAQRAMLHGVLVDVTCHGRFYDFFERREGRWQLVFRQPIYERDRIDPVAPGERLVLDTALLARFPEGYRHLAYLQSQAGMRVRRDMPGRAGPEVTALHARGAAWLNGAPGHPAEAGFGDTHRLSIRTETYRDGDDQRA